MSSTLRLRGEYDIWRRDELRAVLNRAQLDGDVTIDMTAVTLMDAGAAGLLIAFQRRLRQRAPNARVVLVNAPPIVRRVLELCQAASLFVFSP